MAAPVVPMNDANTVPMARMPVFSAGVPTSEPLIRTPPEMVNRANSRMMNGRYSCATVSHARNEVVPQP